MIASVLRYCTMAVITCPLMDIAAPGLQAQDTASATQSESIVTDASAEYETDFSWYIGLKAAHERSFRYPFGSKNCSGFAVNPIISIGNFTFDADFYYGRQITYSGYLGSENHFRRLIQPNNFMNFHNEFINSNYDVIALKDWAGRKLKEGYFFRNYSRITYTSRAGNFRLVIGDTISRNLIGFQQSLSGGGISIFRKKGNGEIIDISSPIVITRLSKIECRIDDKIICTKILAPGVYSIDDLPEEVKVPGASIKISDQLSRSETLKIDYFGGKYNFLNAGEDDFDFTVVFSHRWNIEDPHRIRYASKPRCSFTYRYGISDDLLCAIGTQYYDGSFTADCTVMYATSLGTFAPNFAISSGDAASGSGNRRTHGTIGGGLWYALPKNDLGISFEVFVGALGNGFGDLGKTRELEDANNEIIRKYNTIDGLTCFLNEHQEESIRQCIARFYTKPIWGITPAFVFSGMWTNSCRLREYTVSLSTTVCGCGITAAAGLTYDDPSGGRNGRSPDKRLTIACSIPLGSECTIDGSFYHHDEDRLRNYTAITYMPESVPGFEICAERYTKPALNNPVVSVKYENKYVNVKIEDNIKNIYADESNGNRANHNNQQRFFFGTSISSDGIGAPRKSSFNVLRSVRKEAKVKKDK
jgi:hypothetical protein